METRIAPCPLGSECEAIKDGVKYLCPWYAQVRGKHPQSDEAIDEWRCSIPWLPVLLIENTQQQRQTGAAVESLRNNIVKSVNTMIEVRRQLNKDKE